MGSLTQDEIDLDRFKAPPLPRLGLDIDDAFAPDEPVVLRVRSQDPRADLVATIHASDTDEELARATLSKSDDEWQSAGFPPMEMGTYRVRVLGHPGSR